MYRGGSSFDGMDHKTSCRPQSLLDQLREEDLLRTRSEITEELRSHNIDAKEIVLQDSPKQVQAPTQKEYTSCPDRPCLLRLNMSLGYQKCKYPIKDEWIGINTGSPFFFETPIFKGCAVLYVAGLDSAPPGIFQVRTTIRSCLFESNTKLLKHDSWIEYGHILVSMSLISSLQVVGKKEEDTPGCARSIQPFDAFW